MGAGGGGGGCGVEGLPLKIIGPEAISFMAVLLCRFQPSEQLASLLVLHTS